MSFDENGSQVDGFWHQAFRPKPNTPGVLSPTFGVLSPTFGVLSPTFPYCTTKGNDVLINLHSSHHLFTQKQNPTKIHNVRQIGHCSTPNQLLICSSFRIENGICSSLSWLSQVQTADNLGFSPQKGRHKWIKEK